MSFTLNLDLSAELRIGYASKCMAVCNFFMSVGQKVWTVKFKCGAKPTGSASEK